MPTGEISTTCIVKDALAQGKSVFIPYTYNPSKKREGQPKSIMDMVELHSLNDFETLESDKWNIPTPSKESLSSRANSFGGKGLSDGEDTEPTGEAGLDLIVMPGMAFDSSFGRLGHGKGFYDYFLRRSQTSSPMPFRGKNYWYFLKWKAN
jgi:5-formyltetrahydrofolate cyclo-ligase